MKNSIKKAFLLSHVNFLCIKRYRMHSYLEILFNEYGYKYPAEWIGMLLGFILFATVFTGISFQNPILIHKQTWINIIDLNIFYFAILIVFELLLQKTVFNINDIRLKIFPLSYKKIVNIKYWYELFDKKIITLFLLAIILLIFFLNNNIIFNFVLALLTITSIVLTYLIACSFIITVRNITYKTALKSSSLFLYVIVSIISISLYYYLQYIKIKEISISEIIIFFIISIFTCIILYFINLFIEKKI